MPEWLVERWQIIKRILERPWLRRLAVVWATIGAYDLLGAQLLPEKIAQKLPRVREVIGMTSGWLPWWAWGWLGTAVLAAASVEFAVRLHRATKSPSLPKALRQASDKPAAPFPDFPIKDLFLYVNPNMLDEPHLSHWEVVGRRLLDYLATERLQAWGRPCLGSREERERESTQVPIKTDYWDGADLTYMFFAEQFTEHTRPKRGSGLPSYADLQLNKAQALSLSWPERKPLPLVPLLEAATRAYDRTRGTMAAAVAEREGGPNETLTWYCWFMWRKVRIYGSRAPSRQIDILRAIPKEQYSFIVEDGAIILKDRYSEARFINLGVAENDLDDVIENINDLDGDEVAS